MSAEMPYINPRDARTFMARTEPQPGGCMVWRGPLVRGLPNAFMNRERLNARRIAWYLAYGEMPTHTFLTCDNPLCVAVAHIRLPHEPRVLELLARGLPSRQIARDLGIDPSWVNRLNRKHPKGSP